MTLDKLVKPLGVLSFALIGVCLNAGLVTMIAYPLFLYDGRQMGMDHISPIGAWGYAAGNCLEILFATVPVGAIGGALAASSILNFINRIRTPRQNSL